MSLDIEVKFNQSFFKKTNKSIYERALLQSLQKTVIYAETECRKEAPVVTGNLRDHHSFKLTNDGGEVVNNSGYASYVAFGTSRQKANNYPLRVAKDIQSQQYIQKNFRSNLQKEGVL